MRQADSYHALMLDYAAGALEPARAVVVETHLALRAEAGRAAALAELAGAAMFEAVPAAAMDGRPTTAGRAPTHPAPGKAEAVRAMIAAALADGGHAPWRPLLFGAEECALPLAGLSLMRMRKGGALPRHGHGGDELTLVLHGAFEDETGRYERGDLAFADESVEHRPCVPRGEACVCLIERREPMRLKGLLGAFVPVWPRASQ